MNSTAATTATATVAAKATAALASVPGSSRRTYRSRDIGTGYGRSSGYALDRRYTSDWAPLRFRCG